ncbi:hypothetical protein [Nocardia iowensis]|uniref:Uncharacterized protein n=1 Tax=Nocardia iowensis TaxID=204891 RepID=A0ABX8RMJ2_NOCIO|nr:hypothetical protein [Nocardia iowensis]QXN90536.1 hypothetical protein KV110_34955 [Nocardia iowensis]
MTIAWHREAAVSGIGAAGVGALAIAVVALWIRHDRRQAWQDSIVAAGCRVVAPLPDVSVPTTLAAVASAVAFGCLAFHSRFLMRGEYRWRRLRAALGTALAVAAISFFAIGLFLVTSTPSDPYLGLDGSGLPCGSG